MSKVIVTDDWPEDKSLGNYPASNKKTPPKTKPKQKVQKGRMQIDNTSTLSLRQ